MEYYSFYFSRIIGECEDSKLLRKKQEHCQSISPSRFRDGEPTIWQNYGS